MRGCPTLLHLDWSSGARRCSIGFWPGKNRVQAMRRAVLIALARLLWRVADRLNRIAVRLFVRATG